jgi:hypothetical protein
MSLRDAIRAVIKSRRLQRLRDLAELRQLEEKLKHARLPWMQGHSVLYKFKGFRDEQQRHVLDILENLRIYLSSADQINDPYDIAPVVRYAGDPNDPEFMKTIAAEQRAIAHRHGMTDEQLQAEIAQASVTAEDLPAATTKSLRETLRQGFRLYCLTLERHHPLQWAHYADGHHGVCLHFSCAQGTLFGTAQEVLYHPTRLPILMPMAALSELELYDRIGLVKAEYWKYESEYRLIAAADAEYGEKRNGDFLSFDSPELIGVTLGMRMTEPDREMLIRHVDKHFPNLPIWEAYEDEERYWMLSRQIR